VFEFMELNNYKYGFTMSLHEYIETIPTLWEETKVLDISIGIRTDFRNLHKKILNTCPVAMPWTSSRMPRLASQSNIQ